MIRLQAVLAVAVAVVAMTATVARATSATATLIGGAFAFVSAPPAVGFSATLDGADQTVAGSQAIDVGDATGSGTGWNITASSTAFTSGSHVLPTGAATVASAPLVACDPGASCTTAANGVGYPYTLPAGASAPPATKLFDAAANSGLGDQTVTLTWDLAIPANAYSGTYNSTWTLSLVSGP